MCHLMHRLRTFLFHRKVLFLSWDIKVFVFLTSPWFTKSVMSWWVLVHETGYIHFWVYLLNQNSLTYETLSFYRYKEGQYISEIFWTIWRTWAKFHALFNLPACSNYSITNYVTIPLLHFLKTWIRENYKW